MSDQGFSNGNGSANGAMGGADTDQAGTAPRLQVLTQFVRDLSFENPGSTLQVQGRPQIDFGVDLQARRLENGPFEVELKLRATAKAEDKALFVLELVYVGLFGLHNIPEDVIERVLLIDGPTLLFPFARRIVADCVRDGGMPPLMIEPIDFAGLYMSKQQELQQQRAAQNPTQIV